MQETWVRSLGWEDAQTLQFFFFFFGGGRLKNLMDKATWQATVQKIAKSQTRLNY